MKRDSRSSDEMPVSAYRMIRERLRVLAELEEWLERPMQWLGLAWIILILVELIGPPNRTLQWLTGALWSIFILDFVIRFTLAPRKAVYLRHNVLTAASLAVPALRMLRLTSLIPALRAARGLKLAGLVGSVNRAMFALKNLTARGGFHHVSLMTLTVVLVGAAGIYAFEKDVAKDQGIKDFGTALWWAGMMMTTMGSEYWPRSPEGRLLTFLLALYTFAIFGYVTATIARFLIGRDTERDKSGSHDQFIRMERELAQLRASLEEMRRTLQG